MFFNGCRVCLLGLLLTAWIAMKSEATRAVTLSCGSEDDTERGLPGAPGKRGAPGPKGISGPKGDAAVCNTCDGLDGRLSELEEETVQQRTHLIGNRRDCDGVARAGFRRSGVYSVTIEGRVIDVYCDFNTDGGNWTVFQRRVNGEEDFYRTWQEYRRGFGYLYEEFWIGLDVLHFMTNSGSYELRVDLEDWEGNTAYALYRNFNVEGFSTNYTLQVSGYSGNAGDSMRSHNNHQFSTRDRDNDVHLSNCAVVYEGAWWYTNCHSTNLNGLYLRDGQINPKGITWHSWKNNYLSMKKVEMKIRPQ